MKSKLNQKLMKEIKEMFDIDQGLRNAWANKKLTEPLINWGEDGKKRKPKTKMELGLINYLVYLVDAAHNARIHRIINQYGYPTSKLIGKKGIFYFFLLVQHQDYDLELQKNCLERCDFAKKEQAYLTDRILLREEKKQLYGTQFQRDLKHNRIISQPIEDIKNVNARRKKIGLRPLKEELAVMNKKFYSK